MRRNLWFVILVWLACCDRPAAVPDAPRAARYYLVGPGGARTLDEPARVLLPRFGVSVVEETTLGAERVGRTRQGRLIAMRDLRPAEPTPFSGETVLHDRLDFGWVVEDDAPLFTAPDLRAPHRSMRVPRLRAVPLVDRQGPQGWWRIRTADGGQAWMPSDTLRVPSTSPRPATVSATQRWLDIDLTTQTLLAMQGEHPLFATLISGGVGRPGTPFASPPGLHRITAKLLYATMDNLEHTGVVPYSYEDVPFTQYIGRVALHGIFWHDRLGHPMSHGCINLSIPDAERVYAFTTAQTLVRVRPTRE